MYGSILTFLVAISVQAFAPRGDGAAWSLSELVHILVYPIAAWALLRFRIRRLMARALHDESAVRDLRIRFSGLVEMYQGLMLVPFALLMYASRYPSLVIEPASRKFEVLGSAFGVLPFVLLLFALWWEAYPLQGVLLGRAGTRARFVLSHARMQLPILLPWLTLMAVMDALRWTWPAGFGALEANPLLQLLYAPIFLTLVGIFLPVLVKTMWGCEPIPPGPLRDRLEALCGVLRLRVGEILYWPLLEGRVMTAGIVGLLPRFRYLLVTPALAEVLNPAEMDGVVAHEAGHVRHGHLWFYLMFFLGYMCILAVFFRFVWTGLDWLSIANPGLYQTLSSSKIIPAVLTCCVLVLLVVYFRLLFGALSRAFERQADAYALESIGRPEPLISALERISVFSGDIRDLPSWHHGSIADRVAFLAASAADPRHLAAHHARVKRLTRYSTLGIAISAALAVGVHAGPIDHGLREFVNQSKARYYVKHVSQRIEEVQYEIEKHPSDAALWFQLGARYYEIRREVQAEKAYTEAIRLDNTHAEALNNLAWLYLTTANSELRHPDRALALAEVAVRRKPAPYILDTLAEARFRARDVEGALEAIEAALAQNPKNRAYYMAQQKKFRDAVEN